MIHSSYTPPNIDIDRKATSLSITLHYRPERIWLLSCGRSMRYLTLGISLEIYLFSLLRISLWYVLMRDLDFFRSRLRKKN